MNAESQQVFDLGREFREPIDRTVPLVIDGQCYGRFVNSELRAQSARVLERPSTFPATGLRPGPRSKWCGGGR